MKILQIANYKEGVGGISAQVELLTKNLLSEGIDCQIFSLKGSFIHRLISPFSLIRIGKDRDIFHIHACSYRGFLPAIIGISIGRLLKRRILLTYHGGDGAVFFDRHERLVKRFLSRTDANIVLSGFLGSVFDKHGIPYTVIPNILELNPNYFLERETIQPHFISIRSLRPIYNIPCILRAFQIVKSSLSSSTLTIVGDGISRNELELIVTKESIKGVTFVGRVPNSEIPGYLGKSDIMISSPIVDNMPVSLLEGFNSGLLVISSNVGGVPYMIEDGVNGLLFESNDYVMLAEKMLFACTHPESAKKMIYNAYIGLAKYSWDHIRNTYLALCQGSNS